jgi:glutaredoxin
VAWAPRPSAGGSSRECTGEATMPHQKTKPVNTLAVYTKPDCPLCDDAIHLIESVRERIPFDLVLKNILESLDDFEQYKHDIPVIFLNGKELARHRISEDHLIAALRASTSDSPRRL